MESLKASMVRQVVFFDVAFVQVRNVVVMTFPV